MKERPILFSAPMVRALLDGTKTQTRRIVKPQPDHPHFYKRHKLTTDDEGIEIYLTSAVMAKAIKFPYGQIGDRLWVRESWQAWSEFDRVKEDAISIEARERLNYLADGNVWDARSRPSIHMPRWASRITLEITGVRVERLQEISDCDAIEEGVDRTNTSISGYAKERYKRIWGSINGAGSWNENPWVWVIQFKRIEVPA